MNDTGMDQQATMTNQDEYVTQSNEYWMIHLMHFIPMANVNLDNCP